MTASFLNRTTELICVWPGDEPVFPCYGGEVIVVPSTDEVAVEGEGIYRFSSAKDRAGNPVPGTVLLRDITRMSDKGALERVFSAEIWAEGLYDVNKPLLARGFSIVDAIEKVAAAKVEGRPKWRRAKLEEYDAIVRREQERRQSYKTKGQAAPDLSQTDSDRVRRATRELKIMRAEDASQQVSDSDLASAISGTEAAPAESVVSAPKGGDFELEAMRDLLWSQAKEYGVKLNSSEKEAFLDLDVSALQTVNEKVVAAKKARAAEPVAVSA